MAASASRTKECHYAVLGVEMDATESEIRKAYRKAALRWHPDKNQHRVEEATERMKLVTEAYSVLSDASERAWYDAHRESILHGSDGGSSSGGGSLLPNLFPFFSSSSFSGFGDDESGFFSVYARAFDSVARAESRHKESTSSVRDWPKFGGPDSPWSEVASFYRSWSNYASGMSFAWEDEHNTMEAPNRYTRRWMERENAKSRHKGREEWTDRVRALVRFVRKRDPRVAAEAARKAEEREARRLAAEERATAEAKAAAERAAALAEQAEVYREELEAASGFRLADEGPKAKAASSGAGADGESSGQESGGEEEAPGTEAEALAAALGLLEGVDMSVEELVEEFEATRELLESDGGFSVTTGIILATLKEDGTLPKRLGEDAVALLLRSGGWKGVPAASAKSAPEPKPAAAATPAGKATPATAAAADVPQPTVVVLETVGDESEPGKAAFIAAGGTVRADVAAAAGGQDKAAAEAPPGRPCRVCEAVFPDVPSLLAHIQETGHRLPAGAANASAGAEGSSSGKGAKASRRRKGKGAKGRVAPAAGGAAAAKCAACGAEFATRSKLFKHLEETGHAASPDQVKAADAAAKQGKGKRKKVRRKGKRGVTDEDDW